MRWAIAALLLEAFVALGGEAALGDAPLAFSGEITRIDRSAEAVVVKGGEPPRKRKFFLARGALVANAGQAASLAELKRGERVEIIYTQARTFLFASSIAVVGASGENAPSSRE